MELSNEQLLVFLVLLVAVAAMLVIAPTLRVPYPIVLVIGGLALGFVPGMPELELPPDLVLVAVLPPLLYAGTFFTSLHELKLNLRPIGLLSVGLVVVTTLAVAVVAHAAIDDLAWSSAFVLGAIVSPTDSIAATAIARRFGVPRRLVTIVEGESLINDATALVAYRFAVVAVVSGSFSIWEAGLKFVYAVVAGIAIGLGVGWLIRQLRRRLDNPPLEITSPCSAATSRTSRPNWPARRRCSRRSPWASTWAPTRRSSRPRRHVSRATPCGRSSCSC